MFFDNHHQDILDYLQNQITEYPFKQELDEAFVAELAHDFPEVCILEELKTFRWYYENQPLKYVKNVRVALRRWIANANGRTRH